MGTTGVRTTAVAAEGRDGVSARVDTGVAGRPGDAAPTALSLARDEAPRVGAARIAIDGGRIVPSPDRGPP